jgi:hypothetical protein
MLYKLNTKRANLEWEMKKFTVILTDVGVDIMFVITPLFGGMKGTLNNIESLEGEASLIDGENHISYNSETEEFSLNWQPKQIEQIKQYSGERLVFPEPFCKKYGLERKGEFIYYKGHPWIHTGETLREQLEFLLLSTIRAETKATILIKELHLHPGYVKDFCEILEGSKSNWIIFTANPYFINEFNLSIATNRVKKDDVSAYSLFYNGDKLESEDCYERGDSSYIYSPALDRITIEQCDSYAVL